MRVNCPWDAVDEHRGVVAGVEVKAAPAMDSVHIRGGGLDGVRPPVVAEDEEPVRVKGVVVRSADGALTSSRRSARSSQASSSCVSL
jgi:hypothetical protein